jgi:anti-anti-sigma regulatory factor
MNELKVTRSAGNKSLEISLEGPIDERSNLNTLVGSFLGDLVVNCEKVTRVNSVGVKQWMSYFTSLQNSRISFQFEKISPALVEQFNIIKNFACGGKINSLLLPYHCDACNYHFQIIYSTASVQEAQYQPPPLHCPQCQKPASFDEIPEEFFAFLIGDPHA